LKSVDFTAVAGVTYAVDTTSATVTVTLPASPATGDVIKFIDQELKFMTNNLIVDGNGNNVRIVDINTMGSTPAYATPSSTVSVSQVPITPTGPIIIGFFWTGSVWSPC
jgi:NaMN:DMB phosphoribosyltransferase